MVTVLTNRGMALLGLNKPHKARQDFEAAVQLASETLSELHLAAPVARFGLAQILLQEGDAAAIAEAAEIMAGVTKQLEESFGPDYPGTKSAQAALAYALDKKAESEADANPPPDHKNVDSSSPGERITAPAEKGLADAE